jgi:hypothetical protein
VSSSSPNSRRTNPSAASSRNGNSTAVSYPQGASPSAGYGSRNAGTRPSRRANSSASSALPSAAARTASRASLSENRTPPSLDSTAGASLTASTAANPTPNRPTGPEFPDPPSPGPSSRLAEARSVERLTTPFRSRCAPVLAAVNTGPAPCADPVDNTNRTRPGTPARAAASAAFCASSTITRSRYPPRTRSSSRFASSRNRTGAVTQDPSTRSRIAAVSNRSVSVTCDPSADDNGTGYRPPGTARVHPEVTRPCGHPLEAHVVSPRSAGHRAPGR